MGKPIEFYGLTEIDDEGSPDLIFTPWTSVHFFVGGVANSWFDIGIWPWEALHLAYEVKDVLMHNKRENREYNSLVNTLGDTVATTAGHLLFKQKRSWFSLLGAGAALLFCSSNDDVG